MNDELKNTDDKYIRLLADFENFRKNKENEFNKGEVSGITKLLNGLLPAFDSFSYALKYEKNLDEGIKLTINSLFYMLNENDVTFYGEVGDVFDDETMHAVGTTDKPLNGGTYIVKKVIMNGCRYKDQIIRHARVLVGKQF